MVRQRGLDLSQSLSSRQYIILFNRETPYAQRSAPNASWHLRAVDFLNY
ncbi:unnamed protein product [Fusarium venenatum]|uniref:Uncharacterized protein n=1 Tax=Fusarium venenatum TaxID=56646 RepID=A0A2L2U1V4_9HYPO|nr:uncharacterized protein FVRRES_08262 [Fusarium venenatum]CEI68185.1 unnamed protein product [Fusarium venenatum]